VGTVGRVHPMVLATALAASIMAGPPRPTTAMDAGESWPIELSTVDAGDANVAVTADGRLTLAGGRARAASADAPTTEGVLVAAPHRLRAPTGRVTAAVDALRPAGTGVLVEVRSQGADGTWGEWTPAPAILPGPATLVQVRLTLQDATGHATPEVRAVHVTAEPTDEPTPSDDRRPLAFRVFATREGLVGGTTANGHVITERDHFVALPSRRGLSTRDTGDYTVQVCAANGRCAWAPVWDVGPWNTRDDYWNPAGVRQMWTDLARGTPQAQAAYTDGYHNGRDQYDRSVRNPAGIDLADGTFWDALGLVTNAWVTVTYVWTGTGPTGTVTTTGGPLNVRDSPGTDHPPIGLAASHAQVRLQCQATGEPVDGTQGTSDAWLRIAPGRYVAAAYVAATPVPAC